MFEQIFKNIDDAFREDAGCSSELDYIEQTSWILFLKYLDDLDEEKQLAAELAGKSYNPIIDPDYRWESWALPRKKDGSIDHNRTKTGDDLLGFVNQALY